MKYQKILELLYSPFPRQISFPERREVKNIEELMKAIKFYNTKKRLFISIYNYSFNNTKNILMPFIWFDFDSSIEINRNKTLEVCPFTIAQQFHEYLKFKNIKHLFVFSGGGFHCYMFTKNYSKIKNTKNALRNCQLYLLQEAGLMKEESGLKYPIIDKHILGDVARVATIPGTFNEKRGRYANFICESDFKKGFEFIKERAKNNKFGVFRLYGDETIDLSIFDNVPAFELTQSLDFSNEEKTIIEQSKILSKTPDCIAHLLLELKELSSSYRERFIVISYFLSQGFNRKDIEEILKDFLPEDKFKHCVIKERQVEYLQRRNIVCPSCRSMKSEGYCIKECKRRWLNE